jgi:hypothetical protein
MHPREEFPSVKNDKASQMQCRTMKTIPRLLLSCVLFLFFGLVVISAKLVFVPGRSSMLAQIMELNDEYIVMTSNNYGRYSNMRSAFVQSAAFAVYTNRSLMYSRPMNCRPATTWDELINMKRLPVAASALGPNNIGLCSTQSTPTMLVNHKPVSCSSGYTFPRPEQGDHRYFNSLLEWTPVFPPNDKQWLVSEAAEAIRATQCAGILCPWGMFQMDERFQSILVDIESRLEASARISSVVRRFLASHHLLDSRKELLPFVGIHLRLTDIGGVRGSMACRVNASEVVENVVRLKEMTNSTRVLLATDNVNATCASELIAQLAPIHVTSSTWLPGACEEAVFVQEILGMSDAFIGHAGSTFTTAIEHIRRMRYQKSKPAILVSNYLRH